MQSTMLFAGLEPKEKWTLERCWFRTSIVEHREKSTDPEHPTALLRSCRAPTQAQEAQLPRQALKLAQQQPKLAPQQPKQAPRLLKLALQQPTQAPQLPKQAPRLLKLALQEPTQAPQLPKLAPQLPKKTPAKMQTEAGSKEKSEAKIKDFQKKVSQDAVWASPENWHASNDRALENECLQPGLLGWSGTGRGGHHEGGGCVARRIEETRRLHR